MACCNKFWQSVSFLTVAWLLLYSSVCSSEKARGVDMNARGDAVQALSADLVPFIGQPDVNMVVARLNSARLARQGAGDPEMELGIVSFGIVEVLYDGAVPVTGTVIDVIAARIADPEIRAKNAWNQWNNLSLEAGMLAILACRPAPAPGRYEALAAIPLESANSPLSSAIRSAYTIEYFRGPIQQRQDRIIEALASSEAQLRFYALDLLGRRALFGRDGGLTLIAGAIESLKISPDDKIDLADYLSRMYFFRPEQGADPVNIGVVATLARGLTAEGDRERRSSWMRLLAGCVLGEFSPRTRDDQATRLALIRALQSPTAKQVGDALASLWVGADDQERSLITSLREVFLEAAR